MKSIKEKQIDFLNDTVEYYSEDTSRRSIGIGMGTCMYYDERDGKCCAIGRFIEDKKLSKELDDEDNSSVNNNNVFLLLPLSLQELGQKFLYDIQSLHDQDSKWDENGITPSGTELVNLIIENIESGKYE
jgi:hypothetical protein